MNRNKVSRETRVTSKTVKGKPRKRKQFFNPKTMESDAKVISASMKKMKTRQDIFVIEDNTVEYRVLNFLTVFAAIAATVKCKSCDGEIAFKTTDTRGLGFKIAVTCDNCTEKLIPSCSYIGHSYEINRRFIFTMRVLGLGLKSCEKFCGLMDMPKFLYQSSYDILVDSIHGCVELVRDKLFEKAVKEEVDKNSAESNIPNNTQLSVSGDGTWKKRGFTSLYGVSSIIGLYTGKVLDVIVKSAYCKNCRAWESKKDTIQYEDWYEDHQAKCTANHVGSSGKLEVDAIVEIFKRSEVLHGVKYAYYIGDGDSKTYNGIMKANPYKDLQVIKKECIGHVQKRMGSRLRAVKKKKNLVEEN